MIVKFIDLAAQYRLIKNEIDSAVQEVMESAAFSGGPFVNKFEEEFAKLNSAKYCVAVNSGTSALHATLMALNVGHGDEVIVPANSFFATAEAVSLTGATPVFVDCEGTYFNIDPHKIDQAVTDKSKAIIVAHLYGQPAKMDVIKKISLKYDLPIIEDCAQSILSKYEDRFTGTIEAAGCFSFYPGKNLGAYGEGGAILTNDEKLKNKLQALRDHGACKKYYHYYIGHNYRMDGIQGAILHIKLKYIHDWTNKRRENAELYSKYLGEIEEIKLPVEMPNVKHVYHLYVIRTQERNKLREYLTDNGIVTGIHYPIPCHLQSAYSFLGFKRGTFPVCEKLSDIILSLPMSEQLKENEIKYIADKIKEFYVKGE